MLLNDNFKRELEQGVFKNIPGLNSYYAERPYYSSSPYSSQQNQTNVDSISERIGHKIPQLIEKHPVMAPVGSYLSALGNHTPFATAAGATAGTGLGAALAFMMDRDVGKGALLGAGVGGLGSALASWLMSRPSNGVAKQASMVQDPLMAIQSKLLGDATMGAAQKARLINALGGMSEPDLHSLAMIVRGLSGAAVGAIVAKYLLKLGLIGSIAGAALGGMLAMPGNSNLPSTDMFGQKRFVI